MFKSLTGRFLMLTILFVMLAEILIFVPSIARFREDALRNHLERAQIASLALLADDMLDTDLEAELLKNAQVFNVVLRRDEVRQLVLSSPIPAPVSQTFDLRDATPWVLMRDALLCLLKPKAEIIRVIGAPVNDAGLLIEVTMQSQPLRLAMVDYGVRILFLSAVISFITAMLLFVAVRTFLVKPIRGVIGHMQLYARAPEDGRNIISPSAGITELHEAEESLRLMQTELTQALRQKERLAQLGTAVSKISHDLRNILTTTQLFTDRLENSKDPSVARLAPKLVNSITRAVHLCESTLAFGKAQEPTPTLALINLAPIIEDVFEGERLAAPQGNITFSSSIANGFTLRADADQLYRVISNLVRNARQAIMNRHDALDRAHEEIEITAEDTETTWEITVRDSGPGLSEMAQKHLFQPFQGGQRKGGTGLGLAISDELIRAHGGTVKLHETNSNGSSFRITLPKGPFICAP